MFVKDPHEKLQGKSQKDNADRCPMVRQMLRLVDKPGIREYEQGQTDMFVDEIHENLWKKKQWDTVDHRPRAERTTRVVEMKEREPCSVKSMHDVSDEKGGSQMTDTRRLELENDEIRHLYKEKVSRHWTTRNTSSQMTRRVNEPCSLIPTRSKTRNEFLYGPQMAVPVPQSCSDTEPSTLLHGGLR
jgi:hypothetical protein